MIHRNLTEWLNYLEQLHPSTIDMGLERLEKVAHQLNLKKPAPLVITVTGTNGKGSSCAFINALLKTQHFKVGIYTSPHLLVYQERIAIDGRLVTEEELCQAFTAIEEARGNISLTYFEFGTLAALWLFAKASLDAVVLEVGLGGRLDAVNLVDADIAVITSIGIDHQEWLGNTRESVAYEKAGIFRAHHPVVCGDDNPPSTLTERAATLNCPLFVRGKQFNLTSDNTGWQWQGCTLEGKSITLADLLLLPLPLVNAALALQVYTLLGFPIEKPSIITALQNTNVTGRLEHHTVFWHDKSLKLILDVGHNPQAAEFLANYLQHQLPTKNYYAVFGLLADKDLDGVITPLVPFINNWAVAPLNSPRSNDPKVLEHALLNKHTHVHTCSSISEAITWQLNQMNEEDELLIFGSFYVVSEALLWLKQPHS